MALSQTARMIAASAEFRAREAKVLSEQARAIAREFAPDFVQLGKSGFLDFLIWSPITRHKHRRY
ncbi:unnamed protein product [Protopolystoma xenopodis]|uniref:Uncharacterized protein n=1 Tax=Protopolystoma xenopodis TaxID=117903 RepID=A0A448XRA7_9PLAT|nr:unnamed protein product [Protopolystoma xenopodis]